MIDGFKLPMVGANSVRQSLRDDFVGALRRNVVQVRFAKRKQKRNTHKGEFLFIFFKINNSC